MSRDRYTDKVAGLQRASVMQDRAVADGLFDEAIRHARAVWFLKCDLRDERGER